MPAERFYKEQQLHEEHELIFVDAEYHHLIHVMRAKVDDTIEVINGWGHLAKGKIAVIEKKKAVVKLIESHFTPAPQKSIILMQALPRPNRLDFILEKGTELGMTELWLFPGDRSERKDISDNQMERHKTITIAATKQSGRLYLPKIVWMPALSKWQKPAYPLFFGDIATDAQPFKHYWSEAPPQTGVIAIGPESGFSTEETTLLIQWQARSISLSPNILRTDTAAIAALTLYSQWIS